MLRAASLTLALTLTGCASGTPSLPSEPQRPVDRSLLVICPEALPMIEQGTDTEILTAWRRAGEQYHDCAQPHNALVELLKQRGL